MQSTSIATCLAMSSTEVLRASCAPLSAQRRAQQSPWGPMARVRTAPLAHTTRLALPQVSPALTRRPLTCAPPSPRCAQAARRTCCTRWCCAMCLTTRRASTWAPAPMRAGVQSGTRSSNLRLVSFATFAAPRSRAGRDCCALCGPQAPTCGICLHARRIWCCGARRSSLTRANRT